MKKHANLSIFVPHLGCRHMCSFCDQRAISQTPKAPSAKDITALCDKYLPQSGEGVEIAFFGGSFTAVEKTLRLELLSAAYSFVKNKRAQGIRLSTRPDAITPDILNELRAYGVTSIELGAQSMDDDVLRLNLRGHSACDVINASLLIKQNGFSLGLQMMPGLYGVNDYKTEANETLDKLLALKPDTMRIYPAVVLQNTALAELYKSGKYIPLTVDAATQISSKLILKCENAGVKVIRVGLAADAELEKAVLAGPYHPAFRELCENEIYFKLISRALLQRPKGEYTVMVCNGAISSSKGHKKKNEAEFYKMGYKLNFVESRDIKSREIKLIFTSQN